MKKILIVAVAAMALAVVLAPVAQAGVFNYNWFGTGAAAPDCSGPRDNAYDLGGAIGEAIYWYSSEAGAGTAVESNHNCESSGVLAYPVAVLAAGTDANAVGCHTAGDATTGCIAGVASSNIYTPDPSSANGQTESFIRVKTFVLASVNDPDTAFTPANVKAQPSASAVQHIQYTGWKMGSNANAATLRMHQSDWTAHAVRHPMQSGSKRVMTAAPLTGNTNWTSLTFPGTIMPNALVAADFTGSGGVFNVGSTGGTDLGQTPRFGFRIYRATGDASSVTSSDFSPVPLYPQTMRWSAPANDSYWGDNGDGTYYFNDLSSSDSYNVSYNYIAVPVLAPAPNDTSNTDGVPVFFRGSWVAVGTNGGVASPLLTTPATVTAFDASFDPQTGKVTLNWSSTSEEDMAGYNVWRELRLDGKLLGQKVKVGFAAAKGVGGQGASYSLTDTPDLNQYLRMSRGKPITATYALEVVNNDGTFDAAGTETLTLSGRTIQRKSR